MAEQDEYAVRLSQLVESANKDGNRIDWVGLAAIGNALRQKMVAESIDIVKLFPVTGYGTLSNPDAVLFGHALARSLRGSVQVDDSIGFVFSGLTTSLHGHAAGAQLPFDTDNNELRRTHNIVRALVFCETIAAQTGIRLDTVPEKFESNTRWAKSATKLYRIAIKDERAMAYIREGFFDPVQVREYLRCGVDADLASVLR